VAVIYFLLRDADETNVTIVEDVANVSSPIANQEDELANTESQETVVIDIKGSVMNPGVYELDYDKRVHDAIQVAGGFTDNAEQSQINLAQRLQDEMVIYVPKKGEELISGAMDRAGSGVNDGPNKIRINSATLDEITTLNGIGPKKAQAIIDYREEHGLFQSIEDLLEVPGIGEKTLENLKEYIQIP